MLKSSLLGPITDDCVCQGGGLGRDLSSDFEASMHWGRHQLEVVGDGRHKALRVDERAEGGDVVWDAKQVMGGPQKRPRARV